MRNESNRNPKDVPYNKLTLSQTTPATYDFPKSSATGQRRKTHKGQRTRKNEVIPLMSELPVASRKSNSQACNELEISQIDYHKLRKTYDLSPLPRSPNDSVIPRYGTMAQTYNATRHERLRKRKKTNKKKRPISPPQEENAKIQARKVSSSTDSFPMSISSIEELQPTTCDSPMTKRRSFYIIPQVSSAEVELLRSDSGPPPVPTMSELSCMEAQCLPTNPEPEVKSAASPSKDGRKKKDKKARKATKTTVAVGGGTAEVMVSSGPPAPVSPADPKPTMITRAVSAGMLSLEIDGQPPAPDRENDLFTPIRKAVEMIAIDETAIDNLRKQQTPLSSFVPEPYRSSGHPDVTYKQSEPTPDLFYVSGARNPSRYRGAESYHRGMTGSAANWIDQRGVFVVDDLHNDSNLNDNEPPAWWLSQFCYTRAGHDEMRRRKALAESGASTPKDGLNRSQTLSLIKSKTRRSFFSTPTTPTVNGPEPSSSTPPKTMKSVKSMRITSASDQPPRTLKPVKSIGLPSASDGRTSVQESSIVRISSARKKHNPLDALFPIDEDLETDMKDSSNPSKKRDRVKSDGKSKKKEAAKQKAAEKERKKEMKRQAKATKGKK